MKRFLKIIKRLQPYKKWLGLSIFFNVLMAIFTIAGIPLFIPFFEILFSDKKAIVITENGSGIKEDITNLLSGVLSETDPDTALNYIIFLIIFIFLLKNVSRYLAHFFIAPVRNGFIRDLRKELFDHLISLPIQFFKKNKKGDLLARMSMDIQETENSILNILETLIKSPLLILGSLIFMFYVSYELTLLVLLMIPFTILIIGGLSRTLKRQSGVAQEKLGDLMAILDEAVTGNKIIKSFNANQLLKNKFAKTNNSHKHLLTRILWRKDLGSPLAEILAVMVIAGLMYYAARLVFIDKLSPDTFFAFIYAFFIIIEPAKSFSAAFYSYKKGDAALERLEKIFNIQNPVELNPNGISISDLKEKIEFHGVSYQYPDGASPVLKNISLEIKKDKRLQL
jgi:ABC-type multidrug transport system fused ATPase/permease subunit